MLIDDGHQVTVGELHLEVGKLLEAGKGLLQGLSLDLHADLLECVAEGGPSRVLAKGEYRAGLTDGLGIHDLVGGALPQDAMLVDPRLVGEGIAADHRLVVLDRVAGELGHQLRRRVQLGGIDAGLNVVNVGSNTQCHDDLLDRRVARPLAYPVDGTFHLSGAVVDCGQRVGDGEAQVVVTVSRDHDVVAAALHLGHHLGDELSEVAWSGITDRVGDVDRGCPGRNRGATHIDQEVGIRSGAVLGRELDVGAQAARPSHRLDNRFLHLGWLHL